MAGIACDDNVVYVTLVVIIYWIVSISMVYLNKVLMSNEGFSVTAPLFVTWFQCVATSVICWVAGICGDRAQHSGGYSRLNVDEGPDVSVPMKPSFFAQFPRTTYNLGVALQIFPLSCVFVGMISFNNLCLKYVEVSFYNVARSLTIVFNVFFSWVLLHSKSSCKTISCLFVVVFGFVLGTEGEINFSLIGTSCGVLSSFFVSLNSIFTKKVLPAVDDNHWRLTWYNNVNASIIFVPLVYYFELDIVRGHKQQLANKEFWIAMTVAGLFGFAIGIVTVLQIKATSPLSHNISGTAKAAFQSMMAFYIWGNTPSVMGVAGIFIVLGGSLLYTFIKMKEHSNNKFPPTQQQSNNKFLSTQQHISTYPELRQNAVKELA